MEKMVIAFVLIALAAVVMFVKWSASAFGYVSRTDCKKSCSLRWWLRSWNAVLF